jgi:transcriptional regulator with XRE-family HTH domain
MADLDEEKRIRERIGEVVDARRAVRGLTESELAHSADVDDRQMSRVLKGKSGLSVYSLARVARALGWTLGELMYVAFPPNGRRGRRAVPRRRSTFRSN